MFAFFHSPSKKIAQRGCTSVARNLAALKNDTALANVRGVIAEFPDFAAGAPGATKLVLKMHSQTKVIILSGFIFGYAPYLISNLDLTGQRVPGNARSARRVPL